MGNLFSIVLIAKSTNSCIMRLSLQGEPKMSRSIISPDDVRQQQEQLVQDIDEIVRKVLKNSIKDGENANLWLFGVGDCHPVVPTRPSVLAEYAQESIGNAIRVELEKALISKQKKKTSFFDTIRNLFG